MRSFRRRLIDRDLFRHRGLLTGRVLDLGGGRTRGKFPHGRSWGFVVLDEDFGLRPTVVGDARGLPFGDRVFASVKCSELTGYLFEPILAVREVARVLEPGGTAIFTAPFLTPYDHDQHDAVRLTSAWWEWAAGKTGLRLVELEAQGYLFSVISDFESYWVRHWWWLFRYLAYLIMLPLYEILFWWEQRIGVPAYLRRFTSGFLIILKKPQKKGETKEASVSSR